MGTANIEGGEEELGDTSDELTTSVSDDDLNGLYVATVNGSPVVLKRDTRTKAPIVIQFPGDRPFRSFPTRPR
ncbi:MAG: hypothetical protein HYZ28_07215 [Myxococcales bacterium]|nr:hypothetical protein [Myxococcales bacterium]